MRDDEIDWTVLARYLADESTSTERAAVEHWLGSDPRHRDLLVQLQRLWQASLLPVEDVDVAAARQRFEQRLRREPSRPAPARAPAASRHRRRSGRPLLRVALTLAVVGVAALAAVFAFQPASLTAPDLAEVEPRTTATERGQRARVHLIDGSDVVLNVESRLTVMPGFGESHREVELDGEAFFEVATDESSPFVIRTGGAEVQVLGTSFSVRAYASEQTMRVAVAQGRVSLKGTATSDAEAAVLGARSIARMTDARTIDVSEDVEVDEVLAWMSGELVFLDASFEEVVRELARWYDLEITTDLTSESVDRLNAAFTSEPLSEILHSVAAALGVQVERDGRHITFFR